MMDERGSRPAERPDVSNARGAQRTRLRSLPRDFWRLVVAAATLASVPRRLRYACFGMIGAVAGTALVLVRISEAASYLSDDPKTCLNCHIMVPEYATWRHSSHARVTNCNDCHVPHNNLLAKYYFKAKDGSRHSALFTLRKERQVIFAIPESRKVIQENCVRCHSRVLDDVRAHAPGSADRACIDCHREVPHGRVHSLSSTPNAAVPMLTPILPEWMRQTDHAPPAPGAKERKP